MATLAWLEPTLGDAALVAWSLGGAPRLTVVGKLSCSLRAGELGLPLAPEPIVRKERHYDRDPTRGVEAPADTAPWKPLADVTLHGHATAPAGRALEAAAVRLAVHGVAGALLDRTLHVYGDRQGAERPRPFARLPLTWERALGGPGTDNPIGAPASLRAPNVVDPAQPGAPACFAPQSRYWPEAKRNLGEASRKDLDASTPVVPLGFGGAYFQAAPPPQRVAALRGDEWLVLDGMHPALPRVQSRLPGLVLHAVAYDGAGRAARLRPVLDTLHVDADRLVATLVFRASVDLANIRSPDALHLLLALAAPDAPLAWPDAARFVPAGAPGTTAEPEPEPESELGETRMVGLGPAPGPALPFPAQAPPRGPTAFTDELPPVSGAMPFGSVPPPVRPIPEAPPSLRAPPPSARVDVAPPAGDDPDDDPLGRTVAPRGAPAHALPFASGGSGLPAPEAPAHWPARAAQGGDDDEERTVFGALPVAAAALPFGAQTVGAPTVVAPTFGAPGAAPPGLPPTAAPSGGAHGPRRRDGAVIPVFASPPLAVATLAWQITPPRDSLTLIVKGTFRLTGSGPVTPADEPELCTGDVLAAEEPGAALLTPSDFAVLKRRCDVTLVGHARAPKDAQGRAMSAAHVELRFGEGKRGFTRRVAVFGDRIWRRGLVSSPSDPVPFEKVPLSWDRAWGGAGFEKNPAGAGYKAVNGPDGVARMPNLEDPSNLITSPTQSAEPACLGPIAPLWKERWSLLGTYDKAWLETRWPYFPLDFDYAFYQHAPRSQQVELLRGDETFSVTGVSPEHPRLDGALPGLRARAFLEPAPDASQPFREVPLALDTAAFDADRMLLSLVWRGPVEVSEPEAPEIGAIFAMLEPLDAAPATLDDARAAYVALATPLEPAAPAPAPANDPGPTPEPDPAAAEAERMIAEREKELVAALEASGLAAEPPTPPKPPSPEQLTEGLLAAGVSAAEIAELVEAMRPPPAEPPPPLPPPLDARAQVIAALARGESLDEAALSGVDLSGLDLSGASLRGADLRGARLALSKLAGACLAGALLAGADLTDADLAGADLSGAILTKATLVGANLEGATLDLARVDEVVAERARFDGARGARVIAAKAQLAGATFTKATLEHLDLTGAVLDGCTFEGANLSNVRLYFARGARVTFAEANLEGARAEGVRLDEASFVSVNAPGSVWEAAHLARANFFGANLTGASLSRAKLEGASFAQADLREARLRRADLTGAKLLRADLSMADLERAVLVRADLRGACLHEAETWKANLDKAELDLAIVTNTKLARRK